MNILIRCARGLLLSALTFLFLACGGGGGGSSAPPKTYSVGGSINGLTGAGLELTLGSETLSLSSSATSFTFMQQLVSGAAFSVSVSQQPAGQACSLSSASGSIGSQNVSLILTCSDTFYSVGGTVSGLTSGSVALNLNSGVEAISVTAGSTSFSFSEPIADGASFTIDILLPASASDRPKSICTLSDDSGVAGTVDVTNLSLNCRNLGAVQTLDSGLADSAVVALNANMNNSGGAAVSWSDFNSVNNTYAHAVYSTGSWGGRINTANSDPDVSQALSTSILLDDDSSSWSLIHFIDTLLGASQWDSKLAETIVANVPSTLSSDNDAGGVASKLAAIDIELNDERIKLIAADNNDTSEPVCIYQQHTNGSTALAFCIPATSTMKTGAGAINHIALAVHLDSNGTSGRGMVIWEQDASLVSNDVRRIHGAQFDLDGTDISAKLIEGLYDSPDSQFGRPSVTAALPTSEYGFYITFEKPSQAAAIRYVDRDFNIENYDSTLTSLDNCSGCPSWDFRLKPRLQTLPSGDMLLSYTAEDWTLGNTLFVSSTLIIRPINYSASSGQYIFGATVFQPSGSGNLISHYDVDFDQKNNIMVVYRESRRSAQTDPMAGYDVALEFDEVKHFLLPAQGGLMTLNSDGLISSQEYDDDPNVGGDDRIQLWYTKNDTVLDIDFSENGDAVIAWSEWDTSDDANSVKAVILAAP